jgi:TPR repeat protein
MGVTASAEEAVRWYKLAANQGYAAAQRNLGDCYASGMGVTASAEEAVRWYTLAAAQGHAVANVI